MTPEIPPPSRGERFMTVVHGMGAIFTCTFFGLMVWNMLTINSQSREGTSGAFPGGSRGPFGPGGPFENKAVEPIKPDDIEERFKDVLGCDEAKTELEEVVDFLRNPDLFKKVGGRMPKGALLSGPPGTGKTMLARALAKEAGVPFFYMSGAEFEEVFVGVGARRVRDLFEAARKAAPALIFIDEIDAIGGSRREGMGESGSNRATLNQLLTEMDGFKSVDGIFLLAATNTPKTLDKALMRPGRFDRTIAVDPPDQRGRAQILERYLRDIKCQPGCVEPETFARTVPGMTGADLKNVVNIAAVAAARRGAAVVTTDDLEAARDRVQLGAERRTHVVPDAERRLTAWHEAGHALVALLSGASDPVHKATIVPRGNGVAGLVLQLPPDDRQSMTRRQMRTRLRVALAGRAGEEALCGDDDITAGAASDYQQATSLARNMVRRFGMADGALGAVDWASSSDAEGAYLSDATKARIEQETQALVDGALREAREMIRSQRPLLDRIAEQLLARDTLNGEELNALVQAHGASPGALEPLPPVQFELQVDPLSASRTAAQGVADSFAAAGAAAGIINNQQPTTAATDVQ